MSAFPLLSEPDLPRRIVRDVVLFSPANRSARIRLEEGIHIFRRCRLDAFLRDRALSSGASLLTTRVNRIRRTASGRWEILTDDGTVGPFDRLVGADGVRSVVRRHVLAERGIRRGFEDGELTLGLYAYVKGVAREEMVLKFFDGFDGYLWAFPRTDHVSVGICASHRSVPVARLEDELLRFVEDHYREGRIGADDLRGFFIPATTAPAPGAGTGWALVGDAGGFVDPVTREGIFHAMQSAAEVSAGIAAREGFTMPQLPADLRRAHRFKAGFYRREFLERMTRLASVSAAIRRVLADLLEGNQPYSTLKARLLMNALPCGVQVGGHLLSRLIAPPRASMSPGRG
jgi:flavin-dependent dehydrogenase